jgi:hypothetical protein
MLLCLFHYFLDVLRTSGEVSSEGKILWQLGYVRCQINSISNIRRHYNSVWNVVASTLCSVPGANSVTGFGEVVG